MLALSLGLLLSSLVGGLAIGAIAGLLPGVHVNNTSAILLGLSPALAASGVPALYIAIAIVTSTISQSFLDIVPSIFLGAPDDATVLAVMPGHRMLLDGRGIEAVRLSAAGSGLAIVVSMLLIVPVSLIFLYAYPYMWGYMALILAAISAFIILSNRGDSAFPDVRERVTKIWHGAVIYAASGFLGILAFAVEPALVPVVSIAAPTVLLPLLSGLFGAPLLLMSTLAGAAIPRQARNDFSLPAAEIGRSAALGTVAGAMVSWFPAVSSGVATAITGLFAKQDDDADRRYLIAVSGVNTSNAIFSLIALYVIGRPRSGAVAAAQELLGGMISFEGLVLFLAVICVAGALSYLLTLMTGSYAAGVFSRVNYRWLNRGVLLFLGAMCLLMTGAAGMAIFLMAAAVGMAAHILNVRKTCLMGVLLLPCILYFL
ncbi:MAG: Tripartite tricarboxylate transporter TctA family protein [Methanocella sp. PtaU1.Bin125]|nr:MAG: Tripartite tricarboxylate transporter TctA family protein [Methanocella sp. PtaU1.Bin125]